MRMSRFVPLLSAMVLLSSCAEMGSGLAAVGALSSIWVDWSPKLFKEDAPPPLPPEAPLYCYRSLGDKACHAEPLAPPEDTRLIGQIGQAPTLY